jgi:hypothetical protein
MCLTSRLLAAVVAVCALSSPAYAARVAVLSNSLAAETAADYSSKIPTHTFTGIDVSASAPALQVLLDNYDEILLFEDTVFPNSTAVGNRVAEFATAGRAVVLWRRSTPIRPMASVRRMPFARLPRPASRTIR